MADKRILHMLSPLKHVSPFDANMALDAGFDAVLPYCDVARQDVQERVASVVHLQLVSAAEINRRACRRVDEEKAWRRGDGHKQLSAPQRQSLFAGTRGGQCELRIVFYLNLADAAESEQGAGIFAGFERFADSQARRLNARR